MNESTREAIPVFIWGFAIRFVAAGVTTVTDLNPESRFDAGKFGNIAGAISKGLSNGDPYMYTSESQVLVELLFWFSSGDINLVWGTFLAPFWLLPGPSGFYARVGNAFLGAFAVYNVYLIARHHHSHQAGVIAALPMLVYPSFVAVHSTLLREALVLFGITSAARLLMVPSDRLSRLVDLILAGVALNLSLLMREVNGIVYATSLAAALVAWIVASGYVTKRTMGPAGALASVVFVLARPYVRSGIEFLASTRDDRTIGRAVYLPDVIPRTLVELGAYSWIGAAFFLFAPFPWMIRTIPDAIVSVEGIVSMGFTVAAVWGVHSLTRRAPAATVGLLVGLVIGVVFYGVGTVNYGTGMRHRQMFLWVIFLFGGIGISDHVDFRASYRQVAGAIDFSGYSGIEAEVTGGQVEAGDETGTRPTDLHGFRE